MVFGCETVSVSVNAGLWIIFQNFLVRKLATSRWLEDVVSPSKTLLKRFFERVCDCQGELHVPEVDLAFKLSPCCATSAR